MCIKKSYRLVLGSVLTADSTLSTARAPDVITGRCTYRERVLAVRESRAEKLKKRRGDAKVGPDGGGGGGACEKTLREFLQHCGRLQSNVAGIEQRQLSVLGEARPRWQNAFGHSRLFLRASFQIQASMHFSITP